jgi:hypothetical protein
MFYLILLVIFLIQFLVIFGVLMFVIFMARPEVPFSSNDTKEGPAKDDRDHRPPRSPEGKPPHSQEESLEIFKKAHEAGYGDFAFSSRRLPSSVLRDSSWRCDPMLFPLGANQTEWKKRDRL